MTPIIITNKLYYTFRREPVVLYTDNGFLAKTNNLNVCQLGTVDDPSEIIFYKDVRMNSSRITNLPASALPHEAVNKLYVDGTPRKIFHGNVPNLRSFGPAKNDKFGFIVKASSYAGGSFHPVHAFNGLYRCGAEGEWKTDEFLDTGKRPDLVRLWRIVLMGNDSNTERICKWRLEGSTNGDTFTTLYEAPNRTFIGSEVQYFPIETSDSFNIFRLFMVALCNRADHYIFAL